MITTYILISLVAAVAYYRHKKSAYVDLDGWNLLAIIVWTAVTVFGIIAVCICFLP